MSLKNQLMRMNRKRALQSKKTRIMLSDRKRLLACALFHLEEERACSGCDDVKTGSKLFWKHQFDINKFYSGLEFEKARKHILGFCIKSDCTFVDIFIIAFVVKTSCDEG